MRLPVLLLATAVALAAAAPAHAAVAPPMRDADYWATADTLVADVAPTWNEHDGVFREAPGSASTHINAAMLLVYALAARAGHTGPARNDDRAVRILLRLLEPPAYEAPARGRASQVHQPGWRADLESPTAVQHVSTDARVVEALAAAYVVHDRLGLSDATRKLIRQRVCAVARSVFFATPRQNQVNWLADAYAACAQTGGGSDLLRGPYRRWLVWFLEHARQPERRGDTGNLGAGLGLHYLPHQPRAVVNRMLTTEYANIVLTVLGSYDSAIAHGMRPLPSSLTVLARRWQTRVLDGDWMQSGYPNWDTGLGYQRWHLRRYWAWSAEGLLTIAGSRRLRVSPAVAAQAKTTLDNALRLFVGMRSDPAAGDGSTSFGVRSLEGDRLRDPLISSARFAAVAARAAVAGLGAPAAAVTPAPVAGYGYDPDAGRLAVSTARYSAAITAPSSRTGYGGAELARLYDASGWPLSGTGGDGRTATAFGLRVLRAARRVAETQPGERWSGRPNLVRAAARAGGGTFGAPATTQAVRGAGRTRVLVQHRFDADGVQVRHLLTGAAGTRAVLRFPAYGDAVFRAGAVVVTGTARPAAATLHVGLAHGRGYMVRFLTPLPPDAVVQVVRTAPARSAPRTVRTLTVNFAVSAQRLSITYRLVPDPPPAG